MSLLTEHQGRYARALAHASGLDPLVAEAWVAAVAGPQVTRTTSDYLTPGRSWASPEGAGAAVGAQAGRLLYGQQAQSQANQARAIAEHPALPGDWPTMRAMLLELRVDPHPAVPARRSVPPAVLIPALRRRRARRRAAA